MTITSRLSPAACPKTSSTALKSSRSMSIAVRPRPLVSTGAALDHVEELGPVGQAGQVIVERVPMQFGLAIDRVEPELFGQQDLAEQRRAELQQRRVVLQRSGLPLRIQPAQRAEQPAVRVLDRGADVGADRYRLCDLRGGVFGYGHGVGGDLRCQARHHVLAERVRPGVCVALGCAVGLVSDAQVDLPVAVAVVAGDRPERQRDRLLEVADDELAGFPERHGCRERPCERGGVLHGLGSLHRVTRRGPYCRRARGG